MGILVIQLVRYSQCLQKYKRNTIIPYVWNRASAYYERQANKIDNITTLIEKQLEQDRISININPQDYFGKKKKKIKPIDLSTLEE